MAEWRTAALIACPFEARQRQKGWFVRLLTKASTTGGVGAECPLCAPAKPGRAGGGRAEGSAYRLLYALSPWANAARSSGSAAAWTPRTAMEVR
ncbi:hypothetical protein GCM10010350_02680 [Streptomyces galilaeus]|nr:hypothetical protein GCM10010350_02680 [Streptomyces galilaeus]